MRKRLQTIGSSREAKEKPNLAELHGRKSRKAVQNYSVGVRTFQEEPGIFRHKISKIIIEIQHISKDEVIDRYI